MERRLLLVFALTFLIVIGFQPLLRRYLPQPAATPVSAPQPGAQTIPAASQPSPYAGSEAPPASTAAKQAASETETVVENDVYRIVFTNRGGTAKSWVLKKYDDDKGNPLQLVNGAAAEKFGYPLSLWTYDESLRDKLNSALYVGPSAATVNVPGEISFEYSAQDLVVRKKFSFNQSYVMQVETSVLYRGSQVQALPAWPAGFGDQVTAASYAGGRVEYHNDESSERTLFIFPKVVERLAVKSISSGNTLKGAINWGGAADQYFAAVFLPDDPQNAALVTLRNGITVPKDPQKPNPQDTIKVDVVGAAVGNVRAVTSERLYVGPKALHIVESVPVRGVANGEPDLRGLVNFGFFGVIARPLFIWLRWTYEKIVPNWGWAIVIQTLIINIALLPLRLSSMKSALKMQKVQPQMNSIKEKYKKYGLRDPRKQEMNLEIAALMKQEGVSPAGGCLPMIIQMPFLFAYYSMLGAALDLRHAHWLWIRDLSSPDPWHLLPIGIFITMMITQRVTPQAGMDPSQQKMMNLMMPVMMGIISFNLAAGLCLYWSEGNLIGLAQQSIMNRTRLGREMREMALKRARKKEK